MYAIRISDYPGDYRMSMCHLLICVTHLQLAVPAAVAHNFALGALFGGGLATNADVGGHFDLIHQGVHWHQEAGQKLVTQLPGLCLGGCVGLVQVAAVQVKEAGQKVQLQAAHGNIRQAPLIQLYCHEWNSALLWWWKWHCIFVWHEKAIILSIH